MSAQLICAGIQIWCQGALFLASPGWASFRQRQRRRKELPPILLLLLPPPRRLLLLLLLLLLRKISGRPFGVGSGRWVFFSLSHFSLPAGLTPWALPVQLACPRRGPAHPATINYSLSTRPDKEICPYHEPGSLKILFTQPSHVAIHLTEGARRDPIVSGQLQFDSVRPEADVCIC